MSKIVPCEKPCGLEKTCKTPYQTLDGCMHPRVLVIGEAPGRTEDEEGHLFVGESGQVLRSALKESGFDLSEVGFTNVLGCRPPKNATPTSSQRKACKPRLKKALKDTASSVEMVILAGRIPLQTLLGRTKKISKYHGVPLDVEGVIYIPIYHPAYILRNASLTDEFLGDLDKAYSLLEGKKIVEIPHKKADSAYLEEHMEEILATDKLSFDCETSGLEIYDDDFFLIGVSLSWSPEEAVFIPLKHSEADISDYERQKRRKLLKEILCSSVPKVTQNGRFDIQVIRHTEGYWVENLVDDTMIAHHLLDERHGTHNLSDLVKRYLPEYGSYDDEMKLEMERANDYMPDIPLDKIVYYASGDALVTRMLIFKFLEVLKSENIFSLYRDISVPAMYEYGRMEYLGVKVDTEKAEELDKIYGERVEELLENLWSLPIHTRWRRMRLKEFGYKELIQQLEKGLNSRGGPLTPYQRKKLKKKIREADEDAFFNPRSWKQAHRLFFDMARFPVQTKKNKKGDTIKTLDKEAREALFAFAGSAKGRESLDASAVKLLEDYHYFQKIHKLHSSFVTTWKNWCSDDGLVHANFNQTGTLTGRLSTSNPNLQNIPKKIEADEGASKNEKWLARNNVKSMFVSKFGKEGCILEIDESQLELRIMATLSQDEIMCKAYEAGRDLHEQTGRLLHPDYNAVPKETQKKYRAEGKTMNFSSIYALRREFLKMYPGLERWVATTKEHITNYGWVANPFNARRRVPQILDFYNPPMDLIRQGVNFCIQSTGHYMLMRALVEIGKTLREHNLKSHIVFEVHDSLVFDVYKPELDVVYKIAKKIMTDTSMYDWWTIPLTVDSAVGPNWAQLEPVA